MGVNQHITKSSDGQWGVKGAGSSKYTKKFNTQKEAIKHGKQIAIKQKSELLIHSEKGKIRERNTYGKDPFPPKG